MSACIVDPPCARLVVAAGMMAVKQPLVVEVSQAPAGGKSTVASDALGHLLGLGVSISGAKSHGSRPGKSSHNINLHLAQLAGSET